MVITILRNTSILLLLGLFSTIFFTTKTEPDRKLVEIKNIPQEIPENQKNPIIKIEFGWNKINSEGITHYEVFYGKKGEFTNSKVILSPPSDEETVSSGEIEYFKNEVIVAGVRSCTAKGCSKMNGLLVDGLGEYKSEYRSINSGKRSYDCKIASKEDHGYIMIYWGESDSHLWDSVIYFEKKSDGELNFKEFAMDSEDGHKVSI